MAASAVNTVSVIIPFFQRDPGILERALKSVRSQRIPDGWRVQVIVVDDGSPVPASGEVIALTLPEPIQLQVIRQDNGGVGMARNRGLQEAAASASLIAFLDSDDSWPDEHLARAIRATEQGYDFYFADNRREGHHESYLRFPYLPMTSAFLDASS